MPDERMDTPALYFLRMDAALKDAGVTTPTLVLDINRLNANIDRLTGSLPEGMNYRVVAKSLPVPKLIDHVCARAGTSRLMTFSLPMLCDLSRHNETYQQMLGKPLPVKAAAQYYDQHSPDSVAAGNVHWLIDSLQRLEEYADLAQSRSLLLNIVLELDVGLRRGGFRDVASISEAVKKIGRSGHLNLTGLMGYDPHSPKIPSIFGWRKAEQRAVQRRYNSAVQVVQEKMGEEKAASLIRNAAGSPTFRSYEDLGVANEISAGSVLVKPGDFDYPELEDFEMAAFIAAPVLKTIDKPLLPGLATLSPLLRSLGVLPKKMLFLYGGKWMADPVYPEGLAYNGPMGRSSNQEAVNAPAKTPVKNDDFVMLRPTQSEAVLTYFGDIAVYDGDKIADFWRAYPASG